MPIPAIIAERGWDVAGRAFHVTAYEIDTVAVAQLRQTLASCAAICEGSGVRFTSELRDEDFRVRLAA